MNINLLLLKKAFAALLLVCIIVLTGTASYAQEMTVSGTVEDTNGERIPGVAVMRKGTSSGTTTDINGEFQLKLPSNAVLVFSFIGMQTQEVNVGNQSQLSVVLNEDITELQEVVVVGYGQIKKADLTGSVGVIEGSSISERGTVSALQGVQGQVAGVDISQGSGRAGSDFNIQIRGQNSLGGGNPLFVVDGVIVDDIKFLNPQDIERMDILKDASSTAIYGSRGSNGVVIVTTKKGANVKGETTIAYDGYVGVRQNVREPDFMDGEEWWAYRQNSYIVPSIIKSPQTPYDASIGGLSSSPTLARRVATHDYTDWPSYFLQTGIQQNHSVTITGRAENGMKYVIGGGYQEEEGNLLKDFYKRYNFKASVDHKINDKWLAGTSVNLAFSEQEKGSQNAVLNAYRMSPLVTPYDSAGELIFQPAKADGIGFTSSVNPLIEVENSEDNERRTFAVANLYLQYSPAEWINLKSTISPRIDIRRHGIYEGPYTERGQGQYHFASLDKRENYSYTWDNQVNMHKTVGLHDFNFTGLYSMWYQEIEGSYTAANYLPFKSSYHNLGSALQTYAYDGSPESLYSEYALVSYMARLNYTFKDRYLITIANRWDGSSVLADGHKWNSFPSAALGWRISEENFMKNIKPVNSLKLRLSYGFTGNNNISPYTTQVLASSATFYSLGGQYAPGYAPSGVVNSELSWERTREVNIGLDYGLLTNRIVGTIDIYNKLSDGLLLERKLPIETGAGSLVDNVASVRNKGVELSLTTTNIQNNDFTWTTTFNFARNHNEIVELYGGGQDLPGNEWYIGEPIEVNRHYVYDGVWMAGDDILYGQSEGQAKVKDLSGPDGVPDGRIDAEYDMTILGTPAPTWTGGFSSRLSYKNFDFSFSLFTRQGVQVYSPFHAEFTNLMDRGRQKLSMNYYMIENDVTDANRTNDYPMPQNVGQYWQATNNETNRTEYMGFYRDASFVKVQNIMVGYNLPVSLLERFRLKSLRVYANVLNPFVFTDYDGFDPEWADKSINNSGNASVTYQFGVNLKF